MKTTNVVICAAGAVAAVGLAAVSFAPVAAARGWHGHFHHHRGLNRFGDGVLLAGAAPGIDSTTLIVAPAPAPALPPQALTCRHSQEIVTVPSEGGGDRQIRITRC